MPIISVSLTEQNVKDLEDIQEKLGFSGRSEAIRAAMRSLMSEVNERRGMVGRVDGVLIAVNDSTCSERIHDVYHDNHELIMTHIHNHIGREKCMNVMVLSGDAREIIKVLEMFEKLDGISYLKFVRS